MGATAKIPPHLEGEVLTRAGEGWTVRRIATWLGEAHSIKLNYATVQRFLERTRRARAETAKVVVRERLAAGLTTDVDILTQRQTELGMIADGCLRTFQESENADERAGAMSLYLKVQDAQRRTTETKLRFSGADTPDKDDKTTKKASAAVALDEIRKLIEGQEPEPKVH